MNRFAEIEIFVAVGKHLGITAAANILGVSKSHVSKSLSSLEERVGIRLVNRTTRKLSLTPEGDRFLERCESILTDLQEAESLLSQSGGEARGLLRVAAPMSFGTDFIAPVIPEFLERHAAVQIDIDYNDRKVDIVDEGFDLGIRIGTLEESSLIVQKISDTKRYIVVSPKYLEAHGTPSNISDLTNHYCLLYSYATSPVWNFEKEDTHVRVPVCGRVKTNNGKAILEACLAGHGFALLPDFIVSEHVKSGDLKIMFSEWTSWSGGIWALYPHKRHLSLKIRTFVDYLKEQLGKNPEWGLTEYE